MSISAPRYLSRSGLRTSRAVRALTVYRRELVRRAGWPLLFVVAITYLSVTITVVFEAEIAAVLGSLTLATFETPFESPIWPFLILIVATAAGAGTLAEDIGNRSITLYLSRPIHLTDYVTAKAAATGTWLVIASIGPGIAGVGVLAVLGVPSVELSIRASAAFVATGLVATVFFTGLVLALSSLTSNALYAGVGIFGLTLSLLIGASVVAGISGNTSVLYASPLSDIHDVALALFDVAGPGAQDAAVSAAILVGGGAGFAALALGKMRRIEVIGE